MRTWRLALWSGVATLLALPSAQADLLEYSFTDTLGEQRVLQAGSEYANPVSELTFSLSGGLDRKVRMLIRNGGGAVVSSASSELLGANDRILVDGDEFYGERLQLPVPADGSYEFVAQILSSDGDVVSEQIDPVRVHTTPPASGGFDIVQGRPTEVPGFPHRLIGGLYFNYLQINGITSDIPLTIAKIAIKDLEAGNATRTAYTSTWGGSAEWKPEELFSEGEESTFELVAQLRDKAGNVTELTETFYYDKASTKRGPMEAFAIYDPDKAPSTPLLNNSKFEGFIPYTAGMTISQNPIKLITRLSRENYKTFSPFGLGYTTHCRNDCLSGTPFHTDDDYVYLETYKPYEFIQIGANHASLRSVDLLTNVATNYFDVNVAEGTAISPKIKNLKLGFKGDKKLYGSLRIGLDKKDWIFNRVVVTVDPRPYRQRITVDNNHTRGLDRTVFMEPNQTTVTIDMPEYSAYETRQANFANYRTGIRAYAYSHELPIQLNSEMYDRIIDTNFTNPEVNDIKVLEQEKEVHVEVNEDDSDAIKGTVHRIRWFVDPSKSKLELRASNGTYSEVPYSHEIKYTHWKRRFIYDLSAVPDGVYTGIRATAVDAQNNKTVKEINETVVIDNTAPTVHFNLDDGSDVVSLDDIFISVSDNSDSNPQIASVQLTGGPTKDQINLPVREVAGGQYQLEYPILFPSFEPNSSYTAHVVVKDEHGNTSEEALWFNYKPHQITLEGGFDSKFYIPAVVTELVHKDGRRLIETEPLTLADGAPVSGTYDVLATLRGDAPSAYIVNGMRIEPGQTLAILSDHDFSTSSGKLSIGAYPAEAGIEGTAHILVMTTAPNSPILSAELTSWIGRANLSSSSWTVKQVLDPVSIQASPAPGNPCRLTTTMEDAFHADPIDDPVCEFVWTTIPDESERVLSEHGEFQMTQIEGVAFALGKQAVSYELAVYGGDGSRIVVGRGSQDLEVVSAEGSVSLAPTENLTTVYRGIENISLQMKHIDGGSCSLTLDSDQAMRQNKCFFEWTNIPTGLQQNFYSQPYLTGLLSDEGTYPVQWRVSKFAPSGKRVTLNEQTYNIEAINPPAPQIEMSEAGDGLFFAPLGGRRTRDIVVTAPASKLLIDVMRDNVTVFNELYNLLSETSNRVYMSLETLPLALWQEQQFDVTARYAELSGVERTATILAVGVPAETVRPYISTDQRDAVDTELVPLTIDLRDTQNFNGAYDAATMGQWEARVVYDTLDGPVALSNFEPLTGGSLTTFVDISGLGASSLRLFAEARLLSEHPGYQRVERSVTPTFVTVLRGNEIAGSVVSRAFSGPAPLSTYFKLSVSDHLDRRAVGEVIWQVSYDNGGTWTEFVPESERKKLQFHHTFDVGSYLVRAKITNINSGAVSHTDQTSVTAYELLDVELSGPSSVVVGSNGTVLAQVTRNGLAAPESEYVLEWSTDGGETFETGSGKELVVEGMEEGVKRVHVRVRAIEAPIEDRYAYSVDRHNVGMRRLKEPRATLYGSRKLEIGQSYEFSARLKAPYRDMNVAVKGEFVFPDGSTVEGESASYTVREEDTQDGRVTIKYTAWLEGFKDQTSKTVELKAQVWAYEWPEFVFGVSAGTNQVPTTVKASVRVLGNTRNPEEPVYNWVLPDDATDVIERGDRNRTFVIDKPGEYEIIARISDERGNETVLREMLNLEPAPDYDVEISFRPSNSYHRAPLGVFLRPEVTGGHPDDRVDSYAYSVNGQVLKSTNSYARAELEAGDSTVQLKVLTKMGVVATGELVIPVAENQPPVCELEITDTSRSWIGKAKCKDPDGRVVKHNWHVDGHNVSVSGSRVTISKNDQEQMPMVTLSAIDDAGAQSMEVSASHAVN
ncbi:Ig-like domain-containing protein [Pseudovibrio sp. Ad37]|uniref:Ig-like domain-containing protein n=1 Tax=Pseudovibrio sp. Ad37 TaxID=989422 RepID=UPI0007B24637|nr:Ig-like domain-containing protein [Pseudovibrio sp. Ad37]KZL22687.1 hypothetical protein PsAD37_03335 [Pseudovibrio sp. Ad37]